MIRVVLDTNVYISALVFGGVPRKLIELVEVGAFRLVFSQSIRQETERILRQKFHWAKQRVASACQPLWELAEIVTPTGEISVAVDLDDNRILECALEAGASVLVTGDDHLLRLKQFKNIPILTPRIFLQQKLWIENGF